MKKILTLVGTVMCLLAAPQIVYATTPLNGTQTAVVSKIVGTVTANSGLNLRSSASTTAAILTAIPKNTQVDVISKDGSNWYNVKYNGQTGWVSGLYLSVQTVGATAPGTEVSRSQSSDLVENALSLLGVPYVSGGTSRSGFDCSGFTQYVFKGANILLPRTAAEQFKAGTSVSREQLQSGDLVFFTTYAPGATHVGIYIGDGQFVAAANRGVTISSLDENYYSSRYLGARRVR